MKKYRFILMGQQAVITFMNEGLDALIEQEIEFELACIENPADPLEVLDQYNGWFDYANLEEEEFVKLGGTIPEDCVNSTDEETAIKFCECEDLYRSITYIGGKLFCKDCDKPLSKEGFEKLQVRNL